MIIQIDVTGLKEQSALVLRAFLLLVDLNDPEYDPDGVIDTDICIINEETDDVTVKAEADSDEDFYVPIRLEEAKKSRKRKRGAVRYGFYCLRF